MDEIEKIIDVVDELVRIHPGQFEECRKKPALLGWFAGQTLKRLNGEANRQTILNILQIRQGYFFTKIDHS